MAGWEGQKEAGSRKSLSGRNQYGLSGPLLYHACRQPAFGNAGGGSGGGPPAGCPCPLVIKRAFLLTPNGTLRGSWAQKPFCVPISLITGNRLHSTCLTFSEFQQAGSNSFSSRKESVEMREKHKKNNSAALERDPGFPSRGTYNNIFELFCRC